MDRILPDSAIGVPGRSRNHVTLAAGLTSVGSGRKRSFFSRQATQIDHISPMMKEHKPPICYRAMGMIKGGMGLVQATKELGIDMSTTGRWLARDRSGEPLENRTGRGRKSALSRVAKIAIAKPTPKCTIQQGGCQESWPKSDTQHPSWPSTVSEAAQAHDAALAYRISGAQAAGFRLRPQKPN